LRDSAGCHTHLRADAHGEARGGGTVGWDAHSLHHEPIGQPQQHLDSAVLGLHQLMHLRPPHLHARRLQLLSKRLGHLREVGVRLVGCGKESVKRARLRPRDARHINSAVSKAGREPHLHDVVERAHAMFVQPIEELLASVSWLPVTDQPTHPYPHAVSTPAHHAAGGSTWRIPVESRGECGGEGESVRLEPG
jgi:hypothetical protein